MSTKRPAKKPATPKAAKFCNCVKQVNDQLQNYNTMLDLRLSVDFSTGKMYDTPPIVATVKIDTKKRGQPATIICVYCPFCGKRYPGHKKSKG